MNNPIPQSFLTFFSAATLNCEPQYAARMLPWHSPCSPWACHHTRAAGCPRRTRPGKRGAFDENERAVLGFMHDLDSHSIPSKRFRDSGFRVLGLEGQFKCQGLRFRSLRLRVSSLRSMAKVGPSWGCSKKGKGCVLTAETETCETKVHASRALRS